MFKELYSKIKELVMSLFIGKDINNKSLLHITSSVESASNLASYPISSTVFHTGIKYITAKVFTLTSITIVSNGYFDITSGRLSDDAISYISSRFYSGEIPIVLVVKNGVIDYSHEPVLNSLSYIWNYMDTGSPPAGTYTNHFSNIPTYTNRYKWVNGSASTLKIIVTSLQYSGGVISPLDNLFKGSGVSLGNNSIVVNGTNLGELNYITFKNIGASDTFSCNTVGDLLSVVGYSASNTKMHLEATNNNVSIKNSLGDSVFSSSIGQSYVSYTTVIHYTYLTGSASTPNSSWYINNVIAVNSKGCIFAASISDFPVTQANGLWSFCYVATSSTLALFSLVTSSSGTTYSYSLKTLSVGGVLRYVISRELVRLGSDGNPGTLIPPPFTCHVYIN